MIKEEKKEYMKKYYLKHKKEIVFKQKKRRKANRKKILACENEYNEAHREERKRYAKQYKKNNKEKIIIYQKINREKILTTSKQYEKDNKEKRKAYRKANRKRENTRAKARYKANKEKILTNIKERRKIDTKFQLNSVMSTSIRRSLKNGKEDKSWKDLVPYTLEQLKKHLEKQFTDGMSWNNYGINGWVIDHKIPQSIYNFTKFEHRDFKRCWALKNLQPMWNIDNLKKGAKLTKPFQPSLLL